MQSIMTRLIKRNKADISGDTIPPSNWLPPSPKTRIVLRYSVIIPLRLFPILILADSKKLTTVLAGLQGLLFCTSLHQRMTCNGKKLQTVPIG